MRLIWSPDWPTGPAGINSGNLARIRSKIYNNFIAHPSKRKFTYQHFPASVSQFHHAWACSRTHSGIALWLESGILAMQFLTLPSILCFSTLWYSKTNNNVPAWSYINVLHVYHQETNIIWDEFHPLISPTSTRLPHATERRTGRFSAAAGPVPRAAPMPKLTDFRAFLNHLRDMKSCSLSIQKEIAFDSDSKSVIFYQEQHARKECLLWIMMGNLRKPRH